MMKSAFLFYAKSPFNGKLCCGGEKFNIKYNLRKERYYYRHFKWIENNSQNFNLVL